LQNKSYFWIRKPLVGLKISLLIQITKWWIYVDSQKHSRLLFEIL
jgi:hypothetical protein